MYLLLENLMDGVYVQDMPIGDLNAMELKLEISVSKMTLNENFCSRSTMKKNSSLLEMTQHGNSCVGVLYDNTWSFLWSKFKDNY